MHAYLRFVQVRKARRLAGLEEVPAAANAAEPKCVDQAPMLAVWLSLLSALGALGRQQKATDGMEGPGAHQCAPLHVEPAAELSIS